MYGFLRILLLFLGLLQGLPVPGFAAPQTEDPPSATDEDFYAPERDPDRPRSDIFMPFFSFLLPGLDQWWEGQRGSASAYSGVALGSLVYVNNVARSNGLIKDKGRDDEGDKNEDEDHKDESENSDGLTSKDLVKRKLMLGSQVYQVAGGFSAWHAFRTAAYTRQGDGPGQGQYEFLDYEETPGQVLLAPFDFSYLKRSSTLIPLAVGLGLAGLIMQAPHEGYQRDRFSAQDALFTSTYSFNAGTHEEAVFRGWVMPVMMESWQSPFWANVGQSTLFALAHLGTTPVPLAQLLLGYHLGEVTQKNHWTLGEAAFIHTWWDVIAFATMWQFRKVADKETAAALPPPVLWLPPLDWKF